MLRFLPLLASASLALAQQYSISTVAGGAPPATPAPASSISMGPPGRVALDAKGNLYFSSSNCVFEINSAGTVTLVAGTSRAGFSGDGGLAVNAQLNSPQGIAFDPNGNMYIADSRNNRIRQVNTSGIITTFAGNGTVSPGGGPSAYGDGGPATSAQLHLPMGLAVDKSFNVYIADTGDNTIREVTTDGNIATIAGDSFPGYGGDGALAISAELHSPEDVALDSSGNIYIADTANAYVREITISTGDINFIAGDGSVGFSGDGGYATSAGLVAPFALTVDSSGNVYFAENGDSRVRKINVTTLYISTVAGNGTNGFSGDGSTAGNAELNSPTGVAVDSSGNIYIADSLNFRIRKVVSSGNISTFAGNGTVSYSGDGGVAIQAQLNTPQGVAVDAAGNLYVADTLNNVVRKVSPNGTIANFAGKGGAGNSGDGGAATGAQLNGPQGLAVDAAGNLFIADTLNAKVRKVSASGVIATVAGSGTPGYGGDGGAAANAELNLPIAVAVDSSGNLYIADFGNSRVRKVSAGGVITTLAGSGSFGYSGDGGPAVSAQLNGPQGVAVDSNGNVYIADSGNNLIREVTPGGQIAPVAGNGFVGYSGDGGPATSAQLGNPVGVAVDSVGDIYTLDASDRVRQIYPNGSIATIAGNGTPGYSGDGGLATQAQLNGPLAIALGSNGNLYVADTANDAVRMLQYAGTGLSIGAVTNAASNLTGPVSPGEVVVLYGSGLGPAALAQYRLDPATGMVDTSLAGTSVLFGGTPAPVLYTSANQIGVVTPYSTAGSNVQVFVQYQGQASAPLTLPVAAVAPALFTADSSGKGQAAASNQDGTLNGAAHPAKVGSYISLWLTGAGRTNPGGVDGMPGAAPLPQPAAAVSVTIGGQSVTPQYAGQAPGAVAGVMQINAQIPSGIQAGNAVPVVVQVGSVSTQAGVTVAVGN